MDEITKLKAEAYDIVAQIQQLQRLLEEKNKRIGAVLEQLADKEQKAAKASSK